MALKMMMKLDNISCSKRDEAYANYLDFKGGIYMIRYHEWNIHCLTLLL